MDCEFSLFILLYFRSCIYLGRHCPRLVKLDLESCENITDSALKALGYVSTCTSEMLGYVSTCTSEMLGYVSYMYI